MAEKRIVDVLENSEVTKTKEIGGRTYVQAWYGGTTVNVYAMTWDCEEILEELTCWNISDDEGRPVSESEIVKHMEMRMENLRIQMEDRR